MVILSDSCWIKDSCVKYKMNQECNTPSFCVKLFKLDSLYSNSLLSDAQKQRLNLRLDASGVDKGQFERLKTIEINIEQFVKSGKNLYIHSNITGNGKTAWSVRLVQSYFNAIWHTTDLTCRALFISVPRFFLALKDNISEKSDYVEHIKKYALSADLVVWDEIGSKSITQFECDHLLNLINTRLDMKLSNIYTSNLKPEELCDKLGNRLYSRIVNLSEEIVLNGQDKRRLGVEIK